MAAKYFVWGEGVWRELDVASGRVSGWRRSARFVFLRRGRLRVARRRSVLRALAALAAGHAGAAADGRRLPHRSKSESRARHRPEQPPPPAAPAPALACDHHHCCTHRCLETPAPAPATALGPAAAPGVAQREAATQCTRDTATSARALTPSEKTEPAPSTPRTAPVTVDKSDSSSANEFVRPPPTPARDKPRSDEMSALLGKRAPPRTSPRTPPAPADKRRSTRTSGSTADSTAKRQTPATRPEQTNDERARPARTRSQAAMLSDKTESTSDEEPLSVHATGRGEVGAGEGRDAAVCKELVVSEADIAALRGFVARTRPSALARFDADDAYKRALFYAINPLVELERCARLERALASRSAAALPHFAARLGLTPASPSPSPAPAPAAPAPAPSSPTRRTRLSARRSRARSASSDTDKENKDMHSSPNKMRSEPPDASGTKPPPPPRERRRPPPAERSDKQEKDVKVMKAPLTNGVVRSAPAVKRPAAPPAKKKAPLESEDSGVAPSVSDVQTPAVPSHVISKRASRSNVKEYSNLEDHAIVAWVSAGSRASQVGGNLVWRELQEQYPRLTGRERSWHSLRNRYLRYILPALGALHLPPADVSRLRAAASTGSIKRANRTSGLLAAARHPMFKQPERGAASRRLRVVPVTNSGDSASDSDGPVAPKRRSLRVRPLDSSSKDDSGRDEPAKASGSKETSNKDESGKDSSTKQSSGKEVDNKASGSNSAGNNKAGSNKAGSNKPRSPRYSEVTRQFAARHRPPRASSSSPVTSRSPSPVFTPTRSRRLFNPNANV